MIGDENTPASIDVSWVHLRRHTAPMIGDENIISRSHPTSHDSDDTLPR